MPALRSGGKNDCLSNTIHRYQLECTWKGNCEPSHLKHDDIRHRRSNNSGYCGALFGIAEQPGRGISECGAKKSRLKTPRV
jgi:hypothetical protein